MRGYPTIRTAIMVALIIRSLPTVATLSASGQSYNLKYDLGFVGTLYAGGVISIVSDFTNTGQLTIRITGILFPSDFWSNGTRDISLGSSFNLTAGNDEGSGYSSSNSTKRVHRQLRYRRDRGLAIQQQLRMVQCHPNTN